MIRSTSIVIPMDAEAVRRYFMQFNTMRSVRAFQSQSFSITLDKKVYQSWFRDAIDLQDEPKKKGKKKCVK